MLAELTNPRRDATATLAGRLIERLAGEDPALLKVLFEWIRQESGLDLGVDEMDTVQRLEGAAREGFLEGRVERWSDRLRAEGLRVGRAEGLAEGRSEGLAEGRSEERRHLVRLAELKFEARTASRLAQVLADTDDPTRLAEVGAWIITCQSGDDLLLQVSKGAHGDE